MSVRNASGESVDQNVTRVPDLPNAPTIGTASDVGTSRAYNDGAATVAFTPDTTYWGSSITGYTATSTPGSLTATGTSSPITVTGLTSATAYTFTVKANQLTGASALSASSSSMTATTVPQAPTIGTFTDGGTGTTGTLSFTAGATGGSSITGYKFSTDGTNYSSATGTTSPVSLSGLSAGDYTFYLKAVNANGDSTASAGVAGTVILPSGFYPIATVTAVGGETSLSFTSIPSTYTHLQIRGLYRDTNTTYTGGQASIALRFNSDTTSSNYAWQRLQADGLTLNPYNSTSGGFIGAGTFSGGSNTLIYGVNIFDIHDYASSTKVKTTRGFSGEDTNSSASGANAITMVAHLWKSTSPITRIDLNNIYTAFAAGTTFTLYGVK